MKISNKTLNGFKKIIYELKEGKFNIKVLHYITVLKGRGIQVQFMINIGANIDFSIFKTIIQSVSPQDDVILEKELNNMIG